MSEIKLCIVGKRKGLKEGQLFTEDSSRSYLCFVIQMDFILLCAMQSGFAQSMEHTHICVYVTSSCM